MIGREREMGGFLVSLVCLWNRICMYMYSRRAVEKRSR